MKHRITSLVVILILLVPFAITGCGRNERGSSVDISHYASPDTNSANTIESGTPSVEEIEAAMKTDDEFFVVVSTDKTAKTIKLGLARSTKIIQYAYGDLTDFYDRYGSYTTVDKMIPGAVVTIGRTDNNGELTSVSITDKSWYQSDVSKFEVNAEIGMLTIGSTKYVVDKYARIFSGANEIRLSEIQKDDVIDVQGIDKNILSIVVSRGHGTIALTNTSIFEGGWLSLGTKIYTIIEPNMTMVVPEGKYELSVANDGYGDKKTIKVKRDKITVVDLNDYMGEGPSMCELSFEVNIEGAELYIDGEKIDYSAPTQVKYGVHDLVVIATGYEQWQQKLAVGSEKATIQIGEKDLKSTSNKKDTENNQNDTDDDESNNADGEDTNENTENTDENTGDNTTVDNPENTDTNNSDSETGETTENTGENTENGTDNEENSGSNTDYTQYIDTLNNLIDSLTSESNRQNA